MISRGQITVASIAAQSMAAVIDKFGRAQGQKEEQEKEQELSV